MTDSAASVTAGPLAGLHVLIPRAPGRGAGLAHLVEAAGGVAHVAPMISREPIGDSDRATLDDAVAQISRGEIAWVAVTSVNAIDELAAAAERVEARQPSPSPATAERVEARQPSPSPATALGRLAMLARWAAVGPATARALAAHGITADLVAPQNSATGLLAAWPAPTGHLGRVLLPVGDLARDTLEVGLATRGYEPLRLTTYRTVSHPAPPDVVARWQEGGTDAVVLTSGSVAREVADQLGPRSDVVAVAIGEPTREAAEAVGQPVAAVAASATDDGLFAALLEAVAASCAGLLDQAVDPAIIEVGTTPSPRLPGVPRPPENS